MFFLIIFISAKELPWILTKYVVLTYVEYFCIYMDSLNSLAGNVILGANSWIIGHPDFGSNIMR